MNMLERSSTAGVQAAVESRLVDNVRYVLRSIYAFNIFMRSAVAHSVVVFVCTDSAEFHDDELVLDDLNRNEGIILYSS